MEKRITPRVTHQRQANKRKLLMLSAIAGLGSAYAPSAMAATNTWVGGTSNLWNVASNWSSGSIPANGDTLIFAAAGSSGSAIDDNITALTVGGNGIDGIVFGSSASVYTISKSGTTLTLGSRRGGIAVKDTSVFLETISSQLNYSGGQTMQVGATTGAALSSLSLTGVQTGGTPRLTKTGTGLLSISSGTNTLGGLTVLQGTVSIGADNQLSTVATAPAVPTSGWLVLNGGALRTNVNTSFAINANRGIALGDSTVGSGGTLNVYNTTGGNPNLLTLTYNGVIANNGGANNLTKTGVQVLSLGGQNTYTGETRINQGQMTLDFTASGAPTSNIINSSSKLVLGDIPTALVNGVAGAPVLLVQGSNAATTSQTFNDTVIRPGNSSIMARGGTSTFNTTVNLGALTHTAGGTVGFSLLTGGSTGQGVITTSTANTNNILGGWATSAGSVGTGTLPLTQTDWAANDGSGNIVAYTGYTIPTGATPTLANNAANNVKIDAASTGNVSLTFASNISDLNTIMVAETGATARIIAIGTGNTLRLGNYGGIWKSTGTGALTIGVSGSAGTLTAGGASNTAGEIVFNSGTAGITVNSVIANNGSGVVSLVKTGASSLTLVAANTFTGGTIVNQGTINPNVAGAFGGAGRDVTVMPGAVVALPSGGGLTFANNFNLAGSALSLGGVTNAGAVIGTVGNTVSGTVTLLNDVIVGSSGTNGTISGKITGDYSLSAIGVLTLSNTSNDFSGNLGINGLSGPAGGNPVTIKLGANEVIPNGVGKGLVIISGSGSFSAGLNLAILDLNGKSETINGLVSPDTIVPSLGVPGVTVGNERVTNTNVASSTLILGDNDQTATYNGTILDGAGTVAVTKIGAGTQTLGGGNAYTGATIIKVGSLKVDFTKVGSSSTNSPANYISASSSLSLGGGTLEVVGRANGGSLASTAFSGASLTSPVITTTTTGLVVGQAVTGTGIPSGAFITFVTGTTITLSALPTATSGTIAVSSATMTTSQSFNNTILTAGGSGVSVNANAGGGTVVNLNAITRNNGSTLNVVLPSGTQSSANGVTTTSTTFFNNNVLASAANGTAFATIGGTDWASLSGGNVVGLVAGGGSYTTTTTAGTNAGTYSNANVDVTSSEGTLSGVITPNTFRFNTAGANTVSLAAGNNIIGAGGILVTTAVGNNLSTITGGTLEGSSIGNDLVVIQNNFRNGLTIASDIADNGAATSLTKSGAGLLTVSGTNVYTGATYVNAGTLLVSSTGTINSTSAVNVNGGELAYNSSTALTQGITLNSGTISGTGTVTGVAASNANSTIAPGATSAANVNGKLILTGNTSITAGGKLAIDLAKTGPASLVAGTDYDQVAVTTGNTVSVAGGVLVLMLGNSLANGDVYYIVDNQGASAISGTFASGSINGQTATGTFAEGTTFSAGVYQFAISYLATAPSSSSGNDISLTAIAVPEPTSLGLLAIGGSALLARRRRRSVQTA